MRFSRLKYMDKMALIAVFLMAFLLYANTIPNGYSLDDGYVVHNNPRVMQGITGIPEILTNRYVDEEGNAFGYRPIAMITFALEHEVWGQNPHMSHLVNVLLYAIILLLLFRLLRLIFSQVHIAFIFAVVLLFAAHPIHTEVVASLKNRETLLSFMFSLLSLWSFLKWYDIRRIWPVVLGLLAFVLAFLSKQDAVTFAAVIPLTIYYYPSEPIIFDRLKEWRRALFAEPVLYLRLAVLGFFLFYLSTRGWGAWLSILLYFSTLFLLIVYFRNSRSIEPTHSIRRFSYLFLVLGIVLFASAIYFSKAGLALLSLVSFGLFFSRILSWRRIGSLSIPRLWLALIIPLAMLGVAAALVYQLPDLYLPIEDKEVYHFENPQFADAPGYPTWPLAFYTLFFYLQKLVWPHPLGFYYGYNTIPEVSWFSPAVVSSVIFHLGILVFALFKLPRKHILSFAILYYLFTFSIFTNVVIQLPGIVGERMAFFPSLGFSMALAFAVFSLLRIDTKAASINKNKLATLIGVLLLFVLPYSAKTIYRNTQWKDYLTLFAADIEYLSNSAKANHTYANQLLKEAFNNDRENPPPDVQQHYLELAVKHLQRSVEIDPGYKFAWNNLGYVRYQYLGDKSQGMRDMERAIQLDEHYRDAHFNLAYASKLEGDLTRSAHHFRRAIQLKPDHLPSYTELGEVHYGLGQPDSAIFYNRQAAVLFPESAIPHINLGNVYWLNGDTLSAIDSWENAIERQRDHIELATNLYQLYRGRDEEKAAYYRKLIDELREER